MARPRQSKKNRSSKARVKTGTAGRTKAGKKKVNFLGNETIRQNWDHKLTLAQNYNKLGLSVKLAGRTGGVEKKSHAGRDSLAIKNGIKTSKLTPGEVKVVRDAEGNIIDIIDPDSHGEVDSPLNDPLNELDVDSDTEMDVQRDAESDKLQEQNPIVAQLEAQAAAELEDLEQKKRPRQQSSREKEWIEKLVEKYDDDYARMSRDRKLNPMQQSEGDIKRRVKKWKASHG